jgi:hypothetical protein
LRLGPAPWPVARPLGLLALGTLRSELVKVTLADLFFEHPNREHRSDFRLAHAD